MPLCGGEGRERKEGKGGLSPNKNPGYCPGNSQTAEIYCHVSISWQKFENLTKQ